MTRDQRSRHYGGPGAEAWRPDAQTVAATTRALHHPHEAYVRTITPAPLPMRDGGYRATIDGLIRYQACRQCGQAWPCEFAGRCKVDGEVWPCTTVRELDEAVAP